MANNSQTLMNITGMEVITGQKTQDFTILMETWGKQNRETLYSNPPKLGINRTFHQINHK